MLSDRQQELLHTLIDEYVQTAVPVSSKVLAGKKGLELSPATIRGEMSELENLGFLMQLHTSGGRVPTDKAYRYYVNSLDLNNLEASEKTKTVIRDALHGKYEDVHELNRTIAQIVSELSDNLAIAGVQETEEFYKSGLSTLFAMPEFQEFDRMFRMTSFFDDFEELFEQLHKTMEGRPPGAIRVLIGKENPFRRVQDEAMILAEYKLPRNQRGHITLVGPMRMDYGRNIGLVRSTINELHKLTS